MTAETGSTGTSGGAGAAPAGQSSYQRAARLHPSSAEAPAPRRARGGTWTASQMISLRCWQCLQHLAPLGSMPAERLPFWMQPGTVFNLFILQRKQPPEQRQQQKGTLTPSPQLQGARMQPAKKRGLPANMINKVLSRGHCHHYPLPLSVQEYASQACTALVWIKGTLHAMLRALLLSQKSATSMLTVQCHWNTLEML